MYIEFWHEKDNIKFKVPIWDVHYFCAVAVGQVKLEFPPDTTQEAKDNIFKFIQWAGKLLCEGHHPSPKVEYKIVNR